MRIYDAGEEYKDGIDRYSLVLPYPGMLRQETGIKAIGIGFNEGHGQVIIADSFELSDATGISEKGLGRRISIENLERTTRDWLLVVIDRWKRWYRYQDNASWTGFRRVLGK